NLVRFRGVVLKRHVVLETGTSPAYNRYAQGSRHGALHVHDFLHFGTRNRRQMNHSCLGLRVPTGSGRYVQLHYSKTWQPRHPLRPIMLLVETLFSSAVSPSANASLTMRCSHET